MSSCLTARTLPLACTSLHQSASPLLEVFHVYQVAEKTQSKLPLLPLLVTDCPAKEGKKIKTEAEKLQQESVLDKARGQTRVNIGEAFQR